MYRPSNGVPLYKNTKDLVEEKSGLTARTAHAKKTTYRPSNDVPLYKNSKNSKKKTSGEKHDGTSHHASSKYFLSKTAGLQNILEEAESKQLHTFIQSRSKKLDSDIDSLRKKLNVSADVTDALFELDNNSQMNHIAPTAQTLKVLGSRIGAQTHHTIGHKLGVGIKLIDDERDAARLRSIFIRMQEGTYLITSRIRYFPYT